MGFILSFLALLVFCLVYLLEGVIMLFIDVKGRKWFKLTSRRKFNKAYKTDVCGNYLFASFWNLTLSKGGYSFGRFGETLSSAFGKKRIEKSLSGFGFVVSLIIDIVDVTKWTRGGHCKAAIMSDQDIEEFINNAKLGL